MAPARRSSGLGAQLSLTFGSPEHGWLSVELSCADISQSLDVSDVPADSLQQLACAALRLADGWPSPLDVIWCLEPVEIVWRFASVAETTTLSIQQAHNGPFIKVTQARTTDLLLVVWRALRRLEVDPAWREPDQGLVWSHPFPSEEVAALGARLRGTG
jgi:hypothetical protein